MLLPLPTKSPNLEVSNVPCFSLNPILTKWLWQPNHPNILTIFHLPNNLPSPESSNSVNAQFTLSLLMVSSAKSPFCSQVPIEWSTLGQISQILFCSIELSEHGKFIRTQTNFGLILRAQQKNEKNQLKVKSQKTQNLQKTTSDNDRLDHQSPQHFWPGPTDRLPGSAYFRNVSQINTHFAHN